MTKKICILILLFVTLVSFTSCGKGQESEDALSTLDNDKKESTVAEHKQTKKDGNENNEEAEIEVDVDYMEGTEGIRPYAVMIDNEGTKCLPQGGLNLAQVIYEVIVEGGETRLMPIFWNSEPELVGPVRSSRHYFLDYAMEHDAIYIHYGWSPMAENDIAKFKINNVNGVGYGGEIFWDLTKDINNWQDSYTSAEKIEQFIKKAGYRTETNKKQVFSYNRKDIEFEKGIKAEKVRLTYSSFNTCGFEYDADVKTYKRFRQGEPHMERVTGKQLEAKNIIVQYVNNYNIKGDNAGRQEVDTVGSGEGWYITCGKAEKIRWSKASRPEPTIYTYEDGREILLNPGQTWVQIFPLYGKVEIE
ncbi:MAG: DUF3048 domain-containing protein [Acetivibrionales bacterium]|jgi:hypothetical protein